MEKYAKMSLEEFQASEAFDFQIPDCCASVYVSKAKQITRRRGRPAKPKVEKQTF